MGLLSGLLGNASQADVDAISQELEHILIPNEQIDCAYQLIRDYFVFTNKRLILTRHKSATSNRFNWHGLSIVICPVRSKLQACKVAVFIH